MPNSSRTLSKLRQLSLITEGEIYMENRNPRNLERMKIGYKPNGYHLEKPGRSFWHKLNLDISAKYLTAQVVHFEAGPVLEASTREWAIKKHLFKTNDTSAYLNLARVFAQRCLQSGLTELHCNIVAVPNGKIEKFLTTIEKEGISLKESERFLPHRPWDMLRPQKPWDVIEEK